MPILWEGVLELTPASNLQTHRSAREQTPKSAGTLRALHKDQLCTLHFASTPELLPLRIEYPSSLREGSTLRALNGLLYKGTVSLPTRRLQHRVRGCMQAGCHVAVAKSWDKRGRGQADLGLPKLDATSNHQQCAVRCMPYSHNSRPGEYTDDEVFSAFMQPTVSS